MKFVIIGNEFENLVNQEGIKTRSTAKAYDLRFENLVNQEGIKTIMITLFIVSPFENLVNQEGIKTWPPLRLE